MRVSLPGSLLVLALAATPAAGHGALIEGGLVPGIAVKAAYDSGEPMAGAQITVYAPSDPMRPWLTGVSDEEGRFAFLPDPAEEGVWAVQARQAGHGALIRVAVGPGAAAPPAESSPAALGPLQQAIVAAAVVWGLVGTALYFRRGRRGDAPS